jgi:hypothetical protein
LSENGIEDTQTREYFVSNFNKLSNLQLLQANQNIEKTDKHFLIWLIEMYPDQSDRNNFLLQNHISTTVSLNFEDFMSFYETRKQNLREKLKRALGVTSAIISNEN